MATAKTAAYTVLYLEDEPAEALPALSHLVASLPVRLIPVPTVAEALRQIETTRFDLFILDIEITGERSTGIRFAETLRQSDTYATTPILFTSMHTHYSHWLLSTIRHCSFIPKPFTKEGITAEVGVALGIPTFVKKQFTSPHLTIPGPQGAFLQVNPLDISYMEITSHSVLIQYIEGKSVKFKSSSGVLKRVLEQMETHHISCLRQIYRSIIININQIKSITLEKNTGNVYLFNESTPLPMGVHYRDNLQEFL